MDGGRLGMSTGVELTGGGRSGTNGRRRVWIVGLAVMAAFFLLNIVVNATSQIDEFSRYGRDVPDWMPWTWEASSVIAWFMVMPLIGLAVLRLRPPRLSWPATLATHALLTVAVSMLHIGIMVAMRRAVHGLMDDTYRLGAHLPSALLYEGRKDALTYLIVALFFVTIDWTARRTGEAALAPTNREPPARIEIRDGNRTIWLAPADILWAEAAGNYVELHTSNGSLLHRTTLAALERDLASHDFVRIHRSRLVRRTAVRSIETNASGDFETILDGGTRVGGSRRYRAALDS